MKWAKNQTGFTIVELLIVVVVVAILAAITIVAYNGVRQRAVNSAVQANVGQAGKKIQSYKAVNAEAAPSEATYSADLGLPASTPSATYDYYTSTDQGNYCISVTDTTTSPEVGYAHTSKSNGVVPGRCVKNLATNPSFEVGSGSTVPGLSESTRVTVTSTTSNAIYGDRSVLLTPIYTGGYDTFIALASWGIQTNTTYATSISYTALETLGNNPRFRFNIGGVDLQSGSSPQTPGQHRIGWTYAVGASNTLNFIRIMPGGMQGTPPIYIDGLMITATPIVYQYGDGSMPNWSWTGAAHASTSFGPALPR